MTITYHLWCMALFIFRTFEAFYQIFHTSPGGTAAYNILDITLYFWRLSGDFIYWVINDRNRTSIFMIISEEHSHWCKTGKYLLIVISKEKMWFFPMLHLLWSCSTFSFCLLYTCSVTISCYHAMSSNIKYDL